MKNLIIFLGAFLFIVSCSNRNDFDRMIETHFEQCIDKNNCIINLSNTITLEWDSMYIFSNACSLNEIDSILGFHLQNWIDVGDRIVIVNRNKVVYYQEWFPYSSDEIHNVVVFDTQKRYVKLDRKKAVFSVRKVNNFYHLSLIK